MKEHWRLVLCNLQIAAMPLTIYCF